MAGINLHTGKRILPVMRDAAEFRRSCILHSNYSGYDYSYGMGAPSFYSTNTLASVRYSLSTPVRSYYSDYLNVQDPQALPYWSDDSRWREAADLAYYQQRLAADRALSESERMRRWQQRMGKRSR
jgi:hypothetical protein